MNAWAWFAFALLTAALLAVVARGVYVLLTPSWTTLTVVSTMGFAPGMWVQINGEAYEIGKMTGTTLTLKVREAPRYEVTSWYNDQPHASGVLTEKRKPASPS
jgi:hypothetical protein